jgi:hypothetical protein
MEDDYRIKGFYENMDRLDKLILSQAVKNSMSWLGKKKTNEELGKIYYADSNKKRNL